MPLAERLKGIDWNGRQTPYQGVDQWVEPHKTHLKGQNRKDLFANHKSEPDK